MIPKRIFFVKELIQLLKSSSKFMINLLVLSISCVVLQLSSERFAFPYKLLLLVFFQNYLQVFFGIRRIYVRQSLFLKASCNSDSYDSDIFSTYISDDFAKISHRFFQFVSVDFILSGLIFERFFIWFNFSWFCCSKSIFFIDRVWLTVHFTWFRRR